jgi:hypothetical protein
MFSRGATPGKVMAWCYNEDEEDFTKGLYFSSLFPLLITFTRRDGSRHLGL